MRLHQTLLVIVSLLSVITTSATDDERRVKEVTVDQSQEEIHQQSIETPVEQQHYEIPDEGKGGKSGKGSMSIKGGKSGKGMMSGSGYSYDYPDYGKGYKPHYKTEATKHVKTYPTKPHYTTDATKKYYIKHKHGKAHYDDETSKSGKGGSGKGGSGKGKGGKSMMGSGKGSGSEDYDYDDHYHPVYKGGYHHYKTQATAHKYKTDATKPVYTKAKYIYYEPDYDSPSRSKAMMMGGSRQ